jgi:hypothetical protein
MVASLAAGACAASTGAFASARMPERAAFDAAPSVPATMPQDAVRETEPALVMGGEFLDESFEASFPPAGWALDNAASVPYTWHVSETPPYVRTGARAAFVDGQAERTQNERLATAIVDLSGAPPQGLFLSFWWYTDPFWFNGANTSFVVEASTNGTTWNGLFTATNFPESGWAWRNALLDVSSYVGETRFRCRFHYQGIDMARVSIDDVKLGYLVPPGPPANDTCEGALANHPEYTIGPLAGTVTVLGNNTFAANDYPLEALTSCTGYSHAGRDLVWIVDVPSDHHFIATMTTAGNWDDTLFLVSDCANWQTSCVRGDRRLPTGSTVTWMNEGLSTARLFLVASAYDTGRGEFSLEATIGKGVAIESASWGQVKARYRR